MEEKNSYPMSQINDVALCHGNINTNVTSTWNCNISYIGHPQLPFFRHFHLLFCQTLHSSSH